MPVSPCRNLFDAYTPESIKEFINATGGFSGREFPTIQEEKADEELSFTVCPGSRTIFEMEVYMPIDQVLKTDPKRLASKHIQSAVRKFFDRPNSFSQGDLRLLSLRVQALSDKSPEKISFLNYLQISERSSGNFNALRDASHNHRL